jgi:site-specific DNA-methyltransferase (adenine-specific)
VVSWIYGSGFPKSLNISKAIDKAAGVEFAAKPAEGVGFMNSEGKGGYNVTQNQLTRKGKSTEEAKQWDGWGTALKPACEFFTLARKPLSEKTVAANVLKWGTGGINIDGCRVGTDTIKTCGGDKFPAVYGKYKTAEESTHQGRFPANLIHDGSQQVLELFPETNKGFAARFFYCPKASKKDRDEGLEGFEEKRTGGMQATADGSMLTGSGNERITKRKNTHPTVKPTALMQYLCRLITPKGGVVLDPYMGSGSTGKAAVKEGFSFVGCELDEEYYKIAQARIQR